MRATPAYHVSLLIPRCVRCWMHRAIREDCGSCELWQRCMFWEWQSDSLPHESMIYWVCKGEDWKVSLAIYLVTLILCYRRIAVDIEELCFKISTGVGSIIMWKPELCCYLVYMCAEIIWRANYTDSETVFLLVSFILIIIPTQMWSGKDLLS